MLNRRFVALLVVSFLASFVSSPLYSSLLPVYVEAGLARSPLFSAGLRGLFFMLGGLCSVPAGMLCDAFGIKRVLILGQFGPLLAGAIFLTGDPYLLSALCIGLGMTFGFSSTGGQSYLLGAVPPRVLGMAAGGYFSEQHARQRRGQPAGRSHRRQPGIRTPRGSGLRHRRGYRRSVARPVAQPAPSPECGRVGHRFSCGFIDLCRRREVRLLLAIRYLPTSYWGAVTLLIPLLIFRVSGTNTSVTTYSAISLVAACGSQLLTGRLVDRIGRWRPVFISSSLVAVSAVGLTFTAHTLAGLYIFGIVASVFAWSLSTTMPGILQLTAREGEEGRVVGSAHVAWSAGMLSGSLGGGKLIDWGTSVPFAIGAGFALGAVACGIGLYYVHRASDPGPERPAL